MARTKLLVADFLLSFMWVWAGALTKLAIVRTVGAHGDTPLEADLLKVGLSLLCMLLFAWLESITGGAYNPLTALVSAISGASRSGYLFAAFLRIPAQVIGSIVGIKFIQKLFPEIGHGPRLSVGIHHGALAEGLTTFLVVMVSVILTKKQLKGFFLKNWIKSVSKMTLHLLSTDITGGVMNPASAFGWAYARGDHLTLDHLLVYWLAPMQATLLSVWVVSLFTKPKNNMKQGTEESKIKAD